MGEYATRRRDGAHVKIGTCEDMYYLRFHQIHDVAKESGSLDPAAVADRLRFRFPWPDEDRMEAGEVGEWGYHRAVAVDVAGGEGADHRTVQFTAPGYVTSLPCPEGPDANPFTVHRNGFPGASLLVAHRYRPELGRLVPVFKCGGCGSMWRMEDPAEIDAAVVTIRSKADRERDESTKRFWHTIADRLAPFVPAPGSNWACPGRPFATPRIEAEAAEA